ncbi:MAG: hypothetical protein ACQEVT_18480 [Pseudomonadota bacterium]|uniref:hypothetical protein n=1 Tax=Roseovarius salincola TaxID=2978479 RepID=UPI0022A879A0|nr:hypothetical protein [Roseovarius sp. EGI FJ00037]MCZ0814134.1 hypothetical protein [Roseovarius sp. EGI FJ00037]
MATNAVLDPHNHDFDRFLHASVGEDRKGNGVTVLSALARLNLDPWQEARDLAALGRGAAGARLVALLSRVRDVPALEQDDGMVAQELAGLLPDQVNQATAGSASGAKGWTMSTGLIWTLMAVLFFATQLFFTGSSGSGE